MRLVDTHSHLDFPDYKDDLSEVITRAASSGVVRIIVPGTSIASSEEAAALSKKYEEVFFAIGIHPHEADKVKEEDFLHLRSIGTKSDKIVAVGEIGLDYHKGYSSREKQKKLFTHSLKIARDLDLPVILHNREAGEDLLRILGEVMPPTVEGVVHCFSGDKDFLREVLSLGMYVSFAGNITFEKASDLRELAKYVPLERLLLETDSPYITPEPLRGRRNEPANVKYLLDVYARIYSLSKEDVARITTHNANQLFCLGLEEKGAVAYPIRNSLYLNITNRCTNRCTFCTRKYSNYVKGHNLRLDAEPSAEEVIKEIGDVSKYEEVVFCGYGEPTMRLDVIKKVASYVKEKGGKVRLTTNGEGNLINSTNIARELEGLIDRVSVSLNAPEAAAYDRLCRSVFGLEAHAAILDFISDCKAKGIEVEVTCLDMVGEKDVEGCRKVAEDLGAKFRLRHLNVVG